MENCRIEDCSTEAKNSIPQRRKDAKPIRSLVAVALALRLCAFAGTVLLIGRLTRAVAVPDFRLRTFLASLHSSPARNLLRIAGRGFLDVTTFVFCNLR